MKMLVVVVGAPSSSTEGVMTVVVGRPRLSVVKMVEGAPKSVVVGVRVRTSVNTVIGPQAEPGPTVWVWNKLSVV